MSPFRISARKLAEWRKSFADEFRPHAPALRAAATQAQLTQPAAPSVVARLQELLTLAQAGGITAIAVAYVIPAEPYTRSTSHCDTLLGARLLSGAVAELKHEYLHAVRDAK